MLNVIMNEKVQSISAPMKESPVHFKVLGN